MSEHETERNIADAQAAEVRKLFADAFNDGYLFICNLTSARDVERTVANLRAEGREGCYIARADGSVAILAKRPKRKETGARA